MTPADAIAVVGGGVAGLTVAWNLVRRGIATPVVLESGERAGGLLFTETIDGYLCEHAANGFLDSGDGRGAAGLARELEIDVVAATPTAAKRWIWRHDALRQIPSKPPEIARTDLLSWRGKLRLLFEPVAARRPKGDESVAAFARRRLGPEAAEAIVAPFVAGIFAGDPERLSVRSALPRLAAMEAEHGGLFRGMLAARKRGGRPPLVPTLVAPRSGVGAIPDALAGRLGPIVRTRSHVRSLRRDGTGFELTLASGETIRSTRVVLATPPWVSASLIRDTDATLAERLERIETVAAVVAYAGFARGDVPHALDGFGFLVAERDSLRCLGCVFESSVWPRRAPDGHVLLRVIYGGARDPAALALDDAALRDVVARDLRRALGITTPPRFFHQRRHARAIPQYTLGHGDLVAEIERRSADLGLALAGNGYRGIAVNDCVNDAERVVERVVQRR